MMQMMFLEYAKHVLGGFAVMGALFFVLERILPLNDAGKAWDFKKITFTKFFYWVQTIIIHSVFGGMTVVVASDVNHYLKFDGFILSSFVAQVIVFFVVQDFFIYCSHRFISHGPFWNFHKAHHGDADLDWMSTVVVHPLELFQSFFITGIAFVIFPVTATSFGYVVAVNAILFGPLPHSNLWIPTGKWAQRIFVTPQSHRLHHRKQFEAQHSNYATALSLYDWIFGTFQSPSRNNQEQGYGIPDKDFPQNYFAQLIHPLRKMLPRKRL